MWRFDRAGRCLGGIALTALGLAFPGLARAGERGAPQAHIVLVGDSTVADGSGWGTAFCHAQVRPGISCLNLARAGRSTRSYRDDGSWAAVLAALRRAPQVATYVFIQFGHNDQSSRRPGVRTDLDREYPANLARFVDEVRAAGAIPLLVTPLARRTYRGSVLVNSLSPWAAGVRGVAHRAHVPLLDLNADSAALLQRMGPQAAAELAMAPQEKTGSGTTLADSDAAPAPGGGRFDQTHLGARGGALFARQVADEWRAAMPDAAAALLN